MFIYISTPPTLLLWSREKPIVYTFAYKFPFKKLISQISEVCWSMCDLFLLEIRNRCFRRWWPQTSRHNGRRGFLRYWLCLSYERICEGKFYEHSHQTGYTHDFLVILPTRNGIEGSSFHIWSTVIGLLKCLGSLATGWLASSPMKARWFHQILYSN